MVYFVHKAKPFKNSKSNQKEDEVNVERPLVLAAVRLNGRALEHAPILLKSDREIVLAAVSQNGHALQFASRTLRGDSEIAIAAEKSLAHERHARLLKTMELVAASKNNKSHENNPRYHGHDTGLHSVRSCLSLIKYHVDPGPEFTALQKRSTFF